MTVYNDITGFEKHTIICTDCLNYLHYNRRYNIIISAVNSEFIANNDLLNDDIITEASKDKRNAIDIANDLWKNHCFKGVHVMTKGVNQETTSSLEDRFREVSGTAKDVIVWALEG